MTKPGTQHLYKPEILGKFAGQLQLDVDLLFINVLVVMMDELGC